MRRSIRTPRNSKASAASSAPGEDRGRMGLRGIVGEAARDVASGAAHAGMFAALLGYLIALCVGAEAVTLHQLDTQIDDYVAAGASTFVIEYEGRIDGAACEHLGEANGVQAAGAVRQADARIVFAQLPSTSVPAFEATPGALTLLASAHAGETKPLESRQLSGIWLSEEAAANAGVSANADVALSAGGNVHVGGVFDYPDDGRQGDFRYSAVEPAPAEGAFDQCLVKAWPVPDGMDSLLSFTVTTMSDDANDRPKTYQLNASRGVSLDASGMFARRATALLPMIAGAVGLLLGLAATYTRRMQLASDMHCGVPKTALLAQMLIESAFWTLCALVMVLPLYGWVSLQWGNGDVMTVMADLLRSPIAAALGVACGTAASVLVVRERGLFRYFRNRH